MRPETFPDVWRALPWYALAVTPGSERLAQDWLAAQGAPAIVPVDLKAVHPRRKVKRRVLRAFPRVPGYVFAALEAGRWRELTGFRHIRGVVGMGGEPSRLDLRQLERFLDRSAAGAYPAAQHWRGLRAGETAVVEDRIAAGDRAEIFDAASGLRGRVVQVLDVQGEAARVLMPMLGGEREVKISVDRLIAA